MAINQDFKTNFETLKRAFRGEDVAIMECRRRSDGEIVVLICAVGREDGDYCFTPFAEMVNGNPFEMYDPPNSKGGFHDDVAEVVN